MGAALLAARLVLAAVFATAGVAKLLDRERAAEGLDSFGVPERLATPVAIVLPGLELTIAIALVLSSAAWWAAVGALVLLILFVAVIGRTLHMGLAPDCHCFGQLHSAPVGPGTLVRNGALATLAAFVVVHGPGNAGVSATAWIARLGTAEALAIGALALGVTVALAVARFAEHMLRMNGRLLVRIDRLEAALAQSGVALPANGAPRRNGAASGLPVGIPAPQFDLPDGDGHRVSMKDLLAARLPVMLVFTDPGCGPCKEVLPLVAEWQREHAEQLTIGVIAEGKPDAIREKRNELELATVLYQTKREVAEAYRSYGTPTAVVISAEGLIASPLGSGPKGVHEVLERALQRSSELVVHHAAPATGTGKLGRPIPEFELPTIDGGAVSVDDLRGQDTVLLFWNPGCGFCARMKPDLQAWWEQRSATQPQLLVVSRGTREENIDLGPADRIALDNEFALGARFGATGTPMGVLVEAEGRIGSSVAAGANAVFALMAREARAEEALAHD